jgi:hypothetical protein
MNEKQLSAKLAGLDGAVVLRSQFAGLKTIQCFSMMCRDYLGRWESENYIANVHIWNGRKVCLLLFF